MKLSEYANNLLAEVNRTYAILIKEDEKVRVEVNGFFDKKVLDSYNVAYSNWQVAQNNYNSTLIVAKKLNLDWNMELVD